jgi:HlyD family secretion protein
MTATASIATETLRDVLLVPNAALRFEPEGEEVEPPEPREGRRVGRVWTWDGASLTPVEVLPLSSDGRRTAIESGVITEGSEVVVGLRKAK